MSYTYGADRVAREDPLLRHRRFSYSRGMHEQNRANIRRNLELDLGALDAERKVENLKTLGAEPFSVVAYHNRYMSQARRAFIIGSYYPALTAICALGERILNHLVLGLRDQFRSTPEYKEVYRIKSLDDWRVAIETLERWKVLRPETAILFESLRDIRNDTLHFRKKLDDDERSEALRALRLMAEIVDGQFGILATVPWLIPCDMGIAFVRKSAEDNPFVRLVYLPSCALVGPKHTLEWRDTRFEALDDYAYEDREITDEEFIELFKEAH